MSTSSFLAFVIAIGIMLAIILAILVVRIIAIWKVFKKAGEKGWKSLIPFYSGYILYKISGKTYWPWLISYLGYFLSVLIISLFRLHPAIYFFLGLLMFSALIAMIVFDILMKVGLARRFNHGGGYAAGLVFLPTIFLCILAFSKDEVYNPNPQPLYVPNQGQYYNQNMNNQYIPNQQYNPGPYNQGSYNQGPYNQGPYNQGPYGQ